MKIVLILALYLIPISLGFSATKLTEGKRTSLKGETNYRFYYNANSTCGAYNGNVLSLLDHASHLYTAGQLDERNKKFSGKLKPSREIIVKSNDIIRMENNPARSSYHTRVNMFIPLDKFECIPLTSEGGCSTSGRYSQFVSGGINDRKAKFPDAPCGGVIRYHLAGAKPFEESWIGAAKTYHEKCVNLKALAGRGAIQVHKGEALHPMGICLSFLSESDTISRNNRSDPNTPIELDFCMVGGAPGNETQCVGSPPFPKVSEIEPSPEENLCCSGTYAGKMLCSNYNVPGYSNYTFHMVNCLGNGTWGKTIKKIPCGEPPHECCDVDKYDNKALTARCWRLLQ